MSFRERERSARGLMPQSGRWLYAPVVTSVLDRLGVTRTDALLTAVFVVAGLVQTWVWPIAAHGVGELYVVGSTLPLAWRRTHPVEAALVSSAFWLVPLDGYPVLGFVAVILQFYALGSWGTPRVAVALTTAWASASGVVGTLLGPEAPVAAVGAVLSVVAPVLAGRVVRRLREQNHALAALSLELRDEQTKVEEAAIGAERGRIAQELHDVVGHELTLIAIQAEAAATALRVDPDRAVQPVEAIRSTAHRTLDEIRAVLDVLAPGVEPDVADDLSELSRRARAAGIDNTLAVAGTAMPGHAPASLAVNRIVRECLTNAGRHAPGSPVSLRVTWGSREVVVESSNPMNGRRVTTLGRGLTGMRHRAEILGGTFDAGEHDGCFSVRAILPATGDLR
jgi:signal transduction histidine kinase